MLEEQCWNTMEEATLHPCRPSIVVEGHPTLAVNLPLLLPPLLSELEKEEEEREEGEMWRGREH